MVDVVFKEYSVLYAIRAFFIKAFWKIFFFIGFVILLHAAVFLIAGYCLLFGLFTYAFLSTFLGHLLNKL